MNVRLRYVGLLAGFVFCGVLLAPAQVRAEAIIVVPTEIDYGDVDLGTPPRFEKVSITCELSTLTIFSMSIVSDNPNSPFAIATPLFFPITLDVGKSIEVTIAFRPLSEGPHSAVLRIISDGIVDEDIGSAPLLDVQLSGHGGPSPKPAIEVAPPAHDFGDVVLGASRSTLVTISSVGASDLTVAAVALGGGSDADFRIVDPPAPDLVIPPGGSAEIEIEFTPLQLGFRAATLGILSDDPNTPLVEVLLQGVGIEEDPSVLMAEILEFYDLAVAAGLIEGWSSQLRAMRNILQLSSDLLDDGDQRRCASLLGRALSRMDGNPRPRDLITGDAATLAELGGMILELVLLLDGK